MDESPRKILTLLWLLINLFLIGLLISAAFASNKQLSNVACSPLPPPLPTRSPTSSPTLSPTSPPFNSYLTLAPSIYNSTLAQPTPQPSFASPSTSPTNVSPTRSPSKAPTLDNSTVELTSQYYDDGNSYFVSLWGSVMLLVLACGGTSVLRTQRTPFTIGMLTAVSGMMANIMMIVALTSAGEVRRKVALDKTLSTVANNSVLFFSSVEMVLLSSFCIILGRNRKEVLMDTQQQQQQEGMEQDELTTV